MMIVVVFVISGLRAVANVVDDVVVPTRQRLNGMDHNSGNVIHRSRKTDPDRRVAAGIERDSSLFKQFTFTIVCTKSVAGEAGISPTKQELRDRMRKKNGDR